MAQIEEITKVPQKFRYPFFTELQWFALDKYVYSLFGRTHLDLNDDEQDFLLGEIEERKEFYAALDKTHRHITPQVCYLSSLFNCSTFTVYSTTVYIHKGHRSIFPIL